MLRPIVILMTALTVLAGCTLDTEEEVRAQVSQWVELGDTFLFHSSSVCTAGVFYVKSPRINSMVAKARSVDTGMKMLKEGGPVAFDVGGRSPNSLTEAIMSKDLPEGISVLNSGLAGANCMDDLAQGVYYQAIMNPKSRMIFVPDGDAMIIVDREAGALIFVRGNG